MGCRICRCRCLRPDFNPLCGGLEEFGTARSGFQTRNRESPAGCQRHSPFKRWRGAIHATLPETKAGGRRGASRQEQARTVDVLRQPGMPIAPGRGAGDISHGIPPAMKTEPNKKRRIRYPMGRERIGVGFGHKSEVAPPYKVTPRKRTAKNSDCSR